LVLCLLIALAFEFVNGFHDTANAVATVIYTRALKPTVAVMWSGFVNFLGVLSVLSAGAAVAFKIVNLLPADLTNSAVGGIGVGAILAILLTAVAWNLATWFLGIPASSSHTLIGSILGVGLASGLVAGKGLGGLNLDKVFETLRALLVSPLAGFVLAALVLFALRAFAKNPALYREPEGEKPPPWPIRLLLIATCTGVSYAHGSNDGQKGIGLIMLILLAFQPVQFSLNPGYDAPKIAQAVASLREVDAVIAHTPLDKKTWALPQTLASLEARLDGLRGLTAIAPAERPAVRAQVTKALSGLKALAKSPELSAADRTTVEAAGKTLSGMVEFVASWVIYAVALALGIGTMVGWKRVVVTVGEKIGKSHLTYAQGAAAELTTMMTILTADRLGVPVSTTHILSSGIAGTMAASRSGLQARTVRNILMAWVLTLPVTILVSGGLYLLLRGL
jgi:PiT family inorganic phosphate transporter